MSTPGSSSTAPYRYATQRQEPRGSIPHPYYTHLTSNTSTASAYAQQQQQQQTRQSLVQSHSSASTISNATYPYLPPQVQRQHQPTRAPPLLSGRAHSIDELAKIAGKENYDRHTDIKQDLRFAEVCLSEGKRDYEAGDLEWAFIHFARTATLVLSRMPTNPGYREMKAAHRDTLAENGNYCLEKMSEIKPKLVDRYELWRKRNPNVNPELDMPRIVSAMLARDQDELAFRAQTSKERRAASKEEAARRAYAEEERRRSVDAVNHAELKHPNYDEDSRRQEEVARQASAERKAYEDARRRQEEAQRKEADERARTAVNAEYATHRALEEEAKRAEFERQRWAAQEEGRRREEEITRRKQEAAKHQQEQMQREELEAASRRKSEELEHRWKFEESRRLEQDGVVQRQRQAEAEARAARSLLPQGSTPVSVPFSVAAFEQVPMPIPILSAASSSDSSSSSSALSYTHSLTPRQPDELPILPLESPTRAESEDPRQGRHHPQPKHAVPERAVGRTNLFQPPITTTSPPPGGRPLTMQYPSLMTEHQRAQGYTPSLQSMFSPPIGGPQFEGLLFRPNNPEGPSMKNMPSSPDRPPAHIRHMWEMAGYGYKYAQPETHGKPKPPRTITDSRILRPEQVRDDAATVLGKELRIVKVPQCILPRFLAVAAVNTARNKETCGLLMGRENDKEYRIVTLLIPKQHATSDTCTMEEEELVSEFTEKRNLLTLGWIHTHPTQSCFMSSLDLHTHAAFQCTLPEFFAIVCAPKHVPDCGIFRLTDPPGLKTILKCAEKAAFHPHPENPIYTDADKGHVVWVDDTSLEIVDLR